MSSLSRKRFKFPAGENCGPRGGALKYWGYKKLWIPLVLALLFLSPSWGSAQVSSSEEPRQTRSTGESTSAQVAAAPSTDLGEPPVRQLGRATALLPQFSSFRWGPVFLRSADFLEAGDLIRSAGQEPDQQLIASIFRANIALDRHFRRSRLAIQYQPYVSIVNRQVQHNLSTHNLTFDSYYRLTRRWTVSFSDQFSYHSGRVLFDEGLSLDMDLTTGRFLQRHFLDSTERWISSSSNVSFTYDLSPRTRFSITPNYTYSNAAIASLILQNHQYGVVANITHVLGQGKTLGGFYSVEQSLFSSALASTRYHSFGLTYAQHLGPSWSLNTSLGASMAASQLGSRHWTFNGTFALGKTFRKSSLFFVYSRGNDFGELLANTYADRVDASYTLTLTRKLQMGAGGGYYRQIWTPRNTRGKYATGQLSYRLTPTLGWFLHYAHKTQIGEGTQVQSAVLDIVTTGIQWTPASSR
jgi:hypothetical protein